uniref:Ketosynthase family 3 (KS3) domain-containing protein n=1 Tax=Haptolina brevifila TaxID=156173 RepID=A0A7S2BKI6_9EUKA
MAGLTSPGGRSHTFDARADGYVRGEACGSIAVRPCDQMAFSLQGSAVRQDGRSVSLTAPNGLAQQRLLVAAMQDAHTATHALTLNEAHGTGTKLGDPIEMGSLVSAVLTNREESLVLGGIKANSGHAEPAAGMSGLLKLALELQFGKAPPNAQLRQLNPFVSDALIGVLCTLVIQLAAISDEHRVGGVSSFGFSGTIAHAVLMVGARDVLKPMKLSSAYLPTLVYRRRRFHGKVMQAFSEQAAIRAERRKSALKQSGKPPRVVKPYDVAQVDGKIVPELVAKYVAAHAASRKYMTDYRVFLCDNRNIANFSLALKDTIHPIVVQKATGSHVVDIDGNKMIDVSGGFGPIVFGHNAPFVREAVQKMMDADSWALGYEHKIVGECSRKFCQVTGNERVTWVNTGTEATTLAMRLCRLHTNRKKVVMFLGSYHGHFDGFLGVPMQLDAPEKCVPLAAGIARGFVQDLVVLEYDTAESLVWIDEHSDEVAGVFCETIQNRNPPRRAASVPVEAARAVVRSRSQPPSAQPSALCTSAHAPTAG